MQSAPCELRGDRAFFLKTKDEIPVAAHASGVKTGNRIRVYVDALNFYHRVAKEYGIKWVDMKGVLMELIHQAAPGAEIEKLFLFTSFVKEDSARNRQRLYISALAEKYGDCLEVMYGHMIKTRKTGPCADKKMAPMVRAYKMENRMDDRDPPMVTIQTYEEKETDVNLACKMVVDAYTVADRDFDIACLMSNDGDLVYPLRVKKELGQRTLLICPIAEKVRAQRKTPHRLKESIACERDIIDSIPRELLLRHRLPNPVGKWHCPDAPGWGDAE